MSSHLGSLSMSRKRTINSSYIHFGFPGVKKGFSGLGLGWGGRSAGFLMQQNYIEFGSYSVLIQADLMPRRAEIQRPSPNFPTQQHGACLLGDCPCISLKYLLLGFQYVGKQNAT